MTLMQFLYLLIAASFFLLCLLLLLKVLLKKAGVSDGTDRRKKINRTLNGSGLIKGMEPDGFIFGKLGKKKVFLQSSGEGHIIVFGGSGKGKTSALLIPSLRAWKGSFFAIDISGDISRNVQCEDRVLISPDDPENSCLYNVFYAVDRCKTDDEKREKLELLANLIVDIPAKSSDTQVYFLSTGRKMLLAGLLAFYNLGMDFTDICKTIFFSSVKDLFSMIDATGNEIAKGYIASMKEANEKNISGAKDALEEKIKLFADNANIERMLRRPAEPIFPEQKEEESFYPGVLEDKKVFLIVPDKKQEYYAVFMHLVTGQVLDYIGSRRYRPGKDKRILIALDEFASLGHLEILGAFRKFRKNGGNLCVLTQSLADIDLTYSREERKVVMDNCKYTVVLNANDNETRTYFAEMVGKEEVSKTSRTSSSSGSSTSVSTQSEYAIDPRDWKDFGEDLILIHPGGFTRLEMNPYYKD